MIPLTQDCDCCFHRLMDMIRKERWPMGRTGPVEHALEASHWLEFVLRAAVDGNDAERVCNAAVRLTGVWTRLHNEWGRQLLAQRRTSKKVKA